MDFDEIIQKLTEYYNSNPAAVIAAGVILLYLINRRPKLLLTLIIFIAIVFIVLKFIFAKLGNTGLEHKKIPFIEVKVLS